MGALVRRHVRIILRRATEQALAEALQLLWRDGLVFVDGVPESEASVSQIVNRIGPLMNTFYGPTWDVRSVPDAKNVAYTAKYLGFHMDLLYMREPPAFHRWAKRSWEFRSVR